MGGRKPGDVAARQIGQRIREAAARLGVSTEELGTAWGGSRQTAQHWMHGKALPKAADLPRLCQLLGIDCNELLGVKAAAPLEGAALAEHSAWLKGLAATSRKLKLPDRQLPTGRVTPSHHQRRRTGTGSV